VWDRKPKLLLGVGLLGKFLFVGAHFNPGPTGSTPPNGGNSLNNLAEASKQKLLLGWVCIAKLYFGGLTSPQGLQYLTHQMGVLALRIGRRPAKKSCSWQLVYKEIFFLRVHLTPGPTGFTHSKGGICSSIFRSLETCPSRFCCSMHFPTIKPPLNLFFYRQL
jgi:hypothetical protein